MYFRGKDLMTRINVVAPADLTDQHLMAEYRELPMVNAALRRTLGSKRGIRKDQIPKRYTLNKGHVTFFYDKGRFLYDRYHSLIDELVSRNFQVYPLARKVEWTMFSDGLMSEWNPSAADVSINVERIVERINLKTTWYRYKGHPIDETFVTEKYTPLIRRQI